MKKIALFLGLLLGIFFSHESKAQSIFDKWAELKAFHGVMSQTFHPSEKGDLAPIKARSGEMAEKALTLAASKIPTEFRTPKIRKAIKKLKNKSRELDDYVKSAGATDAQITEKLAALHDVFHTIVGLCREENH
ncbi:MAG: hypothetical protein SFU27_09710 [Thermonemataceae bacterium]|nr:hypothetical protein [Thermonemataceae bacterium]